MGKAKGKTHHLADRCKDIMYFDNQVCFGTFVAITKICDNTWSGSINKWTIYTWMHRRVMVLLLVFSILLWIPIQTSKQDISRKRYLRRWTIQNTKMDIPIIFDTTKFGVDFKENKIVFFNIKRLKWLKITAAVEHAKSDEHCHCYTSSLASFLYLNVNGLGLHILRYGCVFSWTIYFVYFS